MRPRVGRRRGREKKAASTGGQAAEALGRSRGGFGTKIHAAVNPLGHPVTLKLTGAEAADSPHLPGLHPRRRYTIGLIPVGLGLKPHDIVRALLDPIAKRNLFVGGVALDAGFAGGETILLLQERKLSYGVRLARKGSGSNRRNDCFAWATGTVREIEWKTEKSRRKVSTKVVVWHERGETESRVFAFGGRWGAKTARKWYAWHFGIETSYRQKNQCRAWTTGVSGAYRLLWEGVAHVIRQVWVYLTSELETVRGWASQLPFMDLLEWLAMESFVGKWPEIHLGEANASPEGS